MVISVISALFTDGSSPGTTRESSTARQTAPTPQPFDISSVNASVLPSTTQTKGEIVVPIAGGSGSVTAQSGTTVKVVGLKGADLEIEYLDGRVTVPYGETTIETQIIEGRETAIQQQEERRKMEAQLAAEKEKADKDARRNRSISLNAIRERDGTITIENRDDFDWTDVRLYLNKSYETRVPRIAARSSVKIRAIDFANKDGTRFNPLSTIPKSLTITADTPLGRTPSEVNWK